MERIGAVLAAIDLEAGADAVLARAAQLAEAHAARLTVLHVIDSEPLSQAAAHMRRDEGELRDRLRRQALDAIAPLIAKAGRAGRAEARAAFGSPHEVVVQVAREQGADVVVIGPGKGRTLKDKVLGSTADRVIRTCAAPVLVVRTRSAEPYRNVVAAVDGSPQSARAFAEARRLAPDAAFLLAHAVGVPLAFEQAMLRAGTPRAEMERYRAALAGEARRTLRAFQRDVLGVEGLAVRILDGEPGPALVRLTRSPRVDLLALGAHGRSVALEALLGGVARRVLGEAACDVLVANLGK